MGNLNMKAIAILRPFEVIVGLPYITSYFSRCFFIYRIITTQFGPPLFKGGGGVNFKYLPRRKGVGESEKLKAGLLKRGDWHFSYLFFSRVIIFTFRNYFTLFKTVLCSRRKIIFFCHHNFMKNDHSKLSKNEPENIP